jgi:hypothetical protein
VEMQLTTDQILTLAPDSSSAKAGRKLANASHWRGLGWNAEALWGECQGSALYQVKVDLSSLTSQCSCPSRKLPCKHCLGLLLLAVDSKSFASAEPPEWVADWLAKRQASSAKKQERAVNVASESSAPSATQLKTAEKRLTSVKKGLDGLDLWLNDLIRQGLANVQTQPNSFWEHQAARMRDAQASALDGRLRRLATLPNASSAWPEKLLSELGKLALLTHAFRQEEQLEAGLREEVRQLIGWSMTQEEVGVRGEAVQDAWSVLGQALEETDRGKVQRTWFSGINSGRVAQILQFSVAGKPFSESFLPGTRQEAELVFWPGSAPQRAFLRSRLGEIRELQGRLAGKAKIEDFLSEVARLLGLQPWLDRFLCVLCDVTPIYEQADNSWYICDSIGSALPLASGDHWLLLALSGGYPVDLAAEWNGEVVRPLGIMVDGGYTALP